MNRAERRDRNPVSRATTPGDEGNCPQCTPVLQSNTDLLEQLVEEIHELRSELRAKGSLERESREPEAANSEQVDELLWQIRQRDDQIAALQHELSSLEQQNQELASKIASQNIRKSVQTVDSSATDALSWDERKRLILQQMEEDTFDADEFVGAIQSSRASGESETGDAELDPVDFLHQLTHDLSRREEELRRKDDEIGELRNLLEQQGGAREGGLAVGAAAIAHLMDADELVREEQQRLKQLQTEWEEKFRQGEIEASLERAKLSRERQELAKKQAELEEQLAHLKRETHHAELEPKSGTGPSRRWLRKLGISDTDD